MKINGRYKKILVIGVVLSLLAGLRGGGYKGDNQARDSYITHGYKEEFFPPAAGNSYYRYQWGLKNDGSLQRITSVPAGQAADMDHTAPGLPADPPSPQETSPDESGGPGSLAPGPGPGEPLTDRDSGQRITDSVPGIDINAEAAWNVYEQTAERRMVTVAVIDTGVDTGHEELAGSIWLNEDEIPGDGIDNDNNGYIDDRNGWNFYSDNNQVFTGEEDDHGTHGAGTIAAAWDGQGITGIADSRYVKIMVLKVLGSQDGKGVSTNVKKAVRYAQDNGAQICNLSIGTLTYDEELRNIIRDSPMLFVVSAGNGDTDGVGYDIDTMPMYPASYPEDNIITVGNLMFDGSLDESSNYGAVSVDIGAPGTHVLGAVPGGYAFMTGTSMAAPMVSGTAALVYSCRTDLSLLEVREAILRSARHLEQLEGKTSTGGILDALRAITYGR